MNPLALISKKAELCGEIVKIMNPELNDDEVVQKSKEYMKKPLLDIQIWHSALKKNKK